MPSSHQTSSSDENFTLELEQDSRGRPLHTSPSFFRTRTPEQWPDPWGLNSARRSTDELDTLPEFSIRYVRNNATLFQADYIFRISDLHLPHTVKCLFHELHTITQEVFLYGSAVAPILFSKSEDLMIIRDFDFIIYGGDPRQLGAKGFMQSRHMAQLFQKKIPQTQQKVDVYCHPFSNDLSHHWTKEASCRLDFTIGSILLRDDGLVFDYYGGIRDYHKKCLHLIGDDPAERLARDPIISLRAVKKIHGDFTPSDELDISLRNTNFLNINYQHLYAIIRKHLEELESQGMDEELAYIILLDNYKLLEKFFNVPEDADILSPKFLDYFKSLLGFRGQTPSAHLDHRVLSDDTSRFQYAISRQIAKRSWADGISWDPRACR